MSPGTPSTLSPQLAAIVTELNDVSTGWQTLLADFPKPKLWQRPAKGGWSVGECIDHLTTTTKQMLPAIDRVVPNGPRGDGPYKMDLKGKLLVWFMEPPYRMKSKTIPRFEPHQSQDPLNDFLRSQEQVLAALRLCNGLDLNRMKIVSPVDERMSYNAYAALKLLPAHQRRHLWQAQQIARLVATE